MCVASKELCQELYKLSSWGRMDNASSTDQYYNANRVTISTDGKPDVMRNWKVEQWAEFLEASRLHYKLDKGHAIPAYDLGYLLRKLQSNDLTIIMRWNRDMGGRASMASWDNKWCVGTHDMPQGQYPVADNAEDAACKLAIELFKQGILTKENQDNE